MHKARETGVSGHGDVSRFDLLLTCSQGQLQGCFRGTVHDGNACADTGVAIDRRRGNETTQELALRNTYAAQLRKGRFDHATNRSVGLYTDGCPQRLARSSRCKIYAPQRGNADGETGLRSIPVDCYGERRAIVGHEIDSTTDSVVS